VFGPHNNVPLEENIGFPKKIISSEIFMKYPKTPGFLNKASLLFGFPLPSGWGISKKELKFLKRKKNFLHPNRITLKGLKVERGKNFANYQGC